MALPSVLDHLKRLSQNSRVCKRRQQSQGPAGFVCPISSCVPHFLMQWGSWRNKAWALCTPQAIGPERRQLLTHKTNASMCKIKQNKIHCSLKYLNQKEWLSKTTLRKCSRKHRKLLEFQPLPWVFTYLFQFYTKWKTSSKQVFTPNQEYHASYLLQK